MASDSEGLRLGWRPTLFRIWDRWKWLPIRKGYDLNLLFQKTRSYVENGFRFGRVTTVLCSKPRKLSMLKMASDSEGLRLFFFFFFSLLTKLKMASDSEGLRLNYIRTSSLAINKALKMASDSEGLRLFFLLTQRLNLQDFLLKMASDSEGLRLITLLIFFSNFSLLKMASDSEGLRPKQDTPHPLLSF